MLCFEPQTGVGEVLSVLQVAVVSAGLSMLNTLPPENPIAIDLQQRSIGAGTCGIFAALDFPAMAAVMSTAVGLDLQTCTSPHS